MKLICILFLCFRQIAVAQLVASPDVVEFGVVRESQRPEGTAMLTNIGTKRVSITELVRTCTCSDAKIDKQEILPGESATVTFWLDPNELAPGPFYKTLYARTDNPNQSSVMMAMRGEFEPLWRIEPGRRIDLGTSGSDAEFKLIPSRAAPEILSIAVLGKGSGLVSTLVTNEVDKTLSVVFTPPIDLVPGFHSWLLSLNLVGTDAKPMVLKVSSETGTSWMALPRSIVLPSKTETPFSTAFHLKPTRFNGLDDPTVVGIDAENVSISPQMDGVTFEPEGQSNRYGFGYRMTVDPEMVNDWGEPITFIFTFAARSNVLPETSGDRTFSVQGPRVTRVGVRQAPVVSQPLASLKPITLEVFAQEGCDDCEWVEEIFLPRAVQGSEARLTVKVSDTTDHRVFSRLLLVLDRFGIKKNAAVYLVVDDAIVLAGRGEIERRGLSVITTALHDNEERLNVGMSFVDVASQVSGTEGEADDASREVVEKFVTRFGGFTVALAGLADGFNPCAFATVVFLTSLLAMGGRNRRVKIIGGLAFCIASFATYFLLGFGFLRAFRALDNIHCVRQIITFSTSAILVILAVTSLVDAARYKRKKVASSVILQLPNSIKRWIHGIARVCFSGPTVIAGGLLCGVGVTLLESVCTGQLYLPVLVWLSREGGGLRVWLFLLLYNIAFILPLLVVFLLAAYGVHNHRLADWSRRHVVPAKILLAGVFLVLAFLLLR